MKLKIISSLVVFTTLLGANENIYQGCGDNESDARLNLANNISTKIESTSFLEKSNNSILGVDMFSKTFKKSSKQTTNLTLKDVTISKNKDQICASIKKDKLLDLTKSLIEKIKSYSQNSLPKYEKDKVVKINDILNDIKNGIVLTEVYKNKLPNNTIEKLQKKQKLFTDLRNKYNAQFAKITVVGEFDKLLINSKNVDANKEVFLKTGNHKFSIDSKNHCPIEENFKLSKNKDFETVINMNDYSYPYIIIDSNKKDAVLKINNKTKALGQKHIFETCDGSELPYVISYQGEEEKGIFELKPDNSLNDSFTFYSKQELKEFTRLAKSYESETRIEVRYGLMGVSLTEEYEDYEDIHTIQLNLITTTKALRYGYGIAYGQTENSKVSELYYNFGFQLTTFGDNNALRIGPIVIVPSLTAQIGFGKHTLYDEKNNITREDKFSENGEEDFWTDYGILKGNFAIDFIVNEHLGLNIFAQKQFTMEESTTFGAGLSLSF